MSRPGSPSQALLPHGLPARIAQVGRPLGPGQQAQVAPQMLRQLLGARAPQAGAQEAPVEQGFAQRTTTSSQSDHVIQFRVVDTMQQPSEPIIASSLELQLLAALIPCDAGLCAPEMTFSLVNLPRPPPVTSGLLLILRSTVLVV